MLGVDVSPHEAQHDDAEPKRKASSPGHRDRQPRDSAKTGAASPPDERPCGSWPSRIAFTISSADRVFAGNVIADVPSAVTRSPHRTSSAPLVKPPPNPGMSRSEP